jgi:hypothetical protein
MEHSSRVRDAMKKNRKALQRLNTLNEESNSKAVEQMDNAGAAEEGEIVGAVKRQENVRETECAFVPEANRTPRATSSQRSVDATPHSSQKRRQWMVPQMPSDHPGIDPRAF